MSIRSHLERMPFIAILRGANFNGVLSVECGTEQQAVRSLAHLSELLGAGA